MLEYDVLDSNTRIFGKYRYANFPKPRFSRTAWVYLRPVGLSLDHWRWSTNAFRRWSTKPLHPAFLFKKIKGGKDIANSFRKISSLLSS